MLLILEDYQFLDVTFYEMINSLLSTGEVPGLYKPEELDPLLSALKDRASDEGFRGTLFAYFVQQIQSHLHVALVLDCNNPSFTITCESNPVSFLHANDQL